MILSPAILTQWHRLLRRTLLLYNLKQLWAAVPAVCFFFLSSCGNEQEIKDGADGIVLDSLQAAASITSEDSAMIVNNGADSWITQSLHSNTVNWNRFHLAAFWYEDSLEQSTYNDDPSFYKDYSPLLKWSPDSSYILDIGSYNAIIIKDKLGNPAIAQGEIDSEIALLDPKTKTRKTLAFFGSASSLISARWIDSTQLAFFTAINEKGDQQADTLLWVIDAKDKFFRKYKLQ